MKDYVGLYTSIGLIKSSLLRKSTIASRVWSTVSCPPPWRSTSRKPRQPPWPPLATTIGDQLP